MSDVSLAGVTGGEVVVAALAAHGVQLVFGIPGTHNLSVFDALSRYGVRTVATTHEQGAGYAADGYARTSGGVGVLVVTSGPAVYNAATALAQAYSDSIPVLVVSPGMPRDLPTDGPGSGYLHEAKDQTGAMRCIVDEVLRPTSHQGIADAVTQAFISFASGRPRPVHLEVPLDLLDEVGSAEVNVAVFDLPPTADHSAVAVAADRLATATRPLLVAGGGARGASGPLTALAELLGAPVVTTINGKGVVDESHPLALGSRLGTAAVMDAVDAADVLLVVGAELGNSDLWQRPAAPRGHVVRVDIDPRMADVNIDADTMLVGDAFRVLDQLGGAVAAQLVERRPVDDRVVELREAAVRESAAAASRWTPWIDAIAAARDENAVLATDNAMCVYFGRCRSVGRQAFTSRPASGRWASPCQSPSGPLWPRPSVR